MKAISLDERRDMILGGNMLKAILKLSVPTIIMSIIMAFIPLTDGLFLNNFASADVAAAVGFSQPYINILNGFSMGLGVAAMALIGQANGCRDTQRVKHLSTQIFTFAFGFGVTLIPISILMAFTAKSLVIESISGYVFSYIALNTISMPLLFMASIFNSMKNSIGQPEATLLRVVILLVLKTIFNTIFLTFFKMGIIGASLSTIISYIILSFWMYYDIFIKKGEMKLTLKGFHFDTQVIKVLLSIAFPSMISYALVNLGFILINQEISAYGVEVLTAQAIASNVNALCFTLPASIGTTTTVMVSMNIGAGNVKKAKKALYYGCMVSLAIALILIALIWPNAETIVHLFNSKNTHIIQVATHALNIYTFSIIGFGVFMVVQGAFIGLGMTKVPLIFSILRMWFFRYIFIMVTQSFLAENSVFWGNLFSNYMAAFIFFIAIHIVGWKSKIKA